tara:strand:- start:417 stop:569 length:153 start_codon:yes stop_codon:yes gene_type:complete
MTIFAPWNVGSVNTITTASDLTGVRTGITVLVVAIVTHLPGIEHSVTASF